MSEIFTGIVCSVEHRENDIVRVTARSGARTIAADVAASQAPQVGDEGSFRLEPVFGGPPEVVMIEWISA